MRISFVNFSLNLKYYTFYTLEQEKELLNSKFYASKKRADKKCKIISKENYNCFERY